MNTPTHALNWFEIPVSDFDRAKQFYESLFQFTMPEHTVGPARMGFLLFDQAAGGRGGAIVHAPGFHQPADTGTLLYLNCDPDLSTVLEKVSEAGGKVLMQKTEIGQNLGYWATILDTEGNRVALHSMK